MGSIQLLEDALSFPKESGSVLAPSSMGNGQRNNAVFLSVSAPSVQSSDLVEIYREFRNAITQSSRTTVEKGNLAKTVDYIFDTISDTPQESFTFPPPSELDRILTSIGSIYTETRSAVRQSDLPAEVRNKLRITIDYVFDKTGRDASRNYKMRV